MPVSYQSLCFGLLLAAHAFTGTVFSQDSAEFKQMRALREGRLEKAKRTPEERKMPDVLLNLLRRAEAAETSASKAQDLATVLSRVKSYEYDQAGRILVTVKFDSLYDTTAILQKVRSLNGLVVNVGEYVPFIHCKLAPKHMRALVALPEVRWLDPVRPVDVQLVPK
jgi:hypothetical protein